MPLLFIGMYNLFNQDGKEHYFITIGAVGLVLTHTVTTFYMAKGLEFDQVFGVFPKKENPMTGQAKYICATRALHELYMYERA